MSNANTKAVRITLGRLFIVSIMLCIPSFLYPPSTLIRGVILDYIALDYNSQYRRLAVDIRNHQNVEMDILLEKHRLAKSHQIEMYGTQLNKVRDELEKRELSDISTDKLLAMELKLLDAVKSTSGGVRFSSTEFVIDLPATEWEA